MKTAAGVSLLLTILLLCFLSPASGVEPAGNVPVTPAATKTAGKEALKAEVAGMEDAFCAMAKEKGVLAAFEHFAAPERRLRRH